MTATYLGTRCCGASTSTPHWVGCRRRLDVNDPHSYVQVVEEIDDPAPFCDQCGIPIGDPGGMPYGEFPDGEGGMFNLCSQCTVGIA